MSEVRKSHRVDLMLDPDRNLRGGLSGTASLLVFDG